MLLRVIIFGTSFIYDSDVVVSRPKSKCANRHKKILVSFQSVTALVRISGGPDDIYVNKPSFFLTGIILGKMLCSRNFIIIRVVLK